MTVCKQSTDPIIVENWTGRTLALCNGLMWPPEGNVTASVYRRRCAGAFKGTPIMQGSQTFSLPIKRENVLLAVNTDIPMSREDLVYPFISGDEVIEFLSLDDYQKIF